MVQVQCHFIPLQGAAALPWNCRCHPRVSLAVTGCYLREASTLSQEVRVGVSSPTLDRRDPVASTVSALRHLSVRSLAAALRRRCVVQPGDLRPAGPPPPLLLLRRTCREVGPQTANRTVTVSLSGLHLDSNIFPSVVAPSEKVCCCCLLELARKERDALLRQQVVSFSSLAR